MLKTQAISCAWNTCYLSDEDEEKILAYIKEHEEKFEFLNDKEKILKAVGILSTNCEIDLYKNYDESDFSTEEINWSEFEERNAEEILKR